MRSEKLDGMEEEEQAIKPLCALYTTSKISKV